MKKRAQLPVFFLSMLAFSMPCVAQQEKPDSLITNELRPVTVTAYRLETSDLTTPLSLTRMDEKQLQTGTQQLGLDEALTNIPGVFVQNGTNFAQDIRLSIRGFGARSAFGIRGVKILVDGFPESTPDGTAQVDAVDPGSLTGVSVIRSGTGGLYGNASGGFVNFSTMRFNDEEWAEIGTTIGQYGFQKYQLRTGGGKPNKFLYSLNSSYTSTDGYRDHSTMKNWLFNGGILLPIDSTLTLRCIATYVNSPLAQDPGALTHEQVELDPTQAGDINLSFDANESLWQLRTGASFSKKFKQKHQVSGSIYHTDRSFEALLPYDYVELERSFTGGTVGYGFNSGKWELTAGFDLETQIDDRRRFNNDDGIKGMQYADQIEKFNSAGVFLVQKIGLGKRIDILPSFRYDLIQVNVKDRYLGDNSDDSFEKDYHAFNSMLSFSFMAKQNVYFFLNGNSNFEVPTLLELNQSGFVNGTINKELKPQQSKSLEFGSKILLANGRVRIEGTVFRIWLDDEIVYYNTVESNQYANLGKSSRNGFELSAVGQFSSYFTGNISYTLSDFKFVKYKVFDGNIMPGIPRNMFTAELRYLKPDGIFCTFGSQYIGEIYADDANKVEVAPYLLGYFRIGYNLKLDKLGIAPFFGINNIFNRKYNANIRTNAFNNLFEPAPPRNYYGGIKIRF